GPWRPPLRSQPSGSRPKDQADDRDHVPYFPREAAQDFPQVRTGVNLMSYADLAVRLVNTAICASDEPDRLGTPESFRALAAAFAPVTPAPCIWPPPARSPAATRRARCSDLPSSSRSSASTGWASARSHRARGCLWTRAPTGPGATAASTVPLAPM